MSEVELALSDYRVYCKVEKMITQATIEIYLHDIAQFFLARPDLQTLQGLASDDIERYILSLRDRGYSTSSAARALSSLKGFFAYLKAELQWPENPALLVPAPRIHRPLPKALSSEDIDRLICAADKGLSYRSLNADALRARDRCMVRLCFASGCRVSELIAIKANEINFTAGQVVLHGKGSKDRGALFDEQTGKLLAEYIEKFRPMLLAPVDCRGVAWKAPQGGEDTVFLNDRARPLSRQAAYVVIRDLGRMAWIVTPLSPHVLRHSFASSLIANGMDVRGVQTLLGHSCPSTTQIYVKITDPSLKSSLSKYHPRDQGKRIPRSGKKGGLS